MSNAWNRRDVLTVGAAVRATRGQYLRYSDAPILAAFHSAAGGRTASALEVWGEDLPYLRPVDSPDDAGPDYFWSYRIGLDELREALREAGLSPRDDRVSVIERSPSGRAALLSVLGARLSGRDMRELLGGRFRLDVSFQVERHEIIAAAHASRLSKG